jgi:hypothetical protein
MKNSRCQSVMQSQSGEESVSSVMVSSYVVIIDVFRTSDRTLSKDMFLEGK